MARCAGFKPDSTPCERIVKASQTFCFSHDPARAGERKLNASRAARSKPNTEIRQVKDRLLGLSDDVLGGMVDRSEAAVAAQVLNVYLRACEIERRTVDMSDLLSRLEDLEATASRIRGA